MCRYDKSWYLSLAHSAARPPQGPLRKGACPEAESQQTMARAGTPRNSKVKFRPASPYGQLEHGKMLAEEVEALGLEDVGTDKQGRRLSVPLCHHRCSRRVKPTA